LNKKYIIPAVVVVVAVLAAGYPVSSWFLGQRVEAAHGKLDEKLAALPFVKLVRHDYRRGVFGADETIDLEISAALFHRAPPKTAESPEEARQEPAAASVPLRLTLKTAIRHGPWLDGAFAAASGTSVIEFNEAIQQKVLEAFGGKPPAEIRTVYDFDGGGRSTMTSPAFKTTLPAPGATEDAPITLSGEGLEMAVEFTKGLARYSLRGILPRFELTQSDGPRVTLTKLNVEADAERLFSDEPMFYVGAQKISVARMEIDPDQSSAEQPKPPKVSLKEIRYDVRTLASGEFIDMIAQTGATGLLVGEQDYGPVAYDFSMKHLRARELTALNREIMALYAKPEVLQDTKRLLRALAPMKGKFIALLLDDPVLSIDRIAFRLPDGDAKLNLSLRLVDAKTGDFTNPLANLILLGKLDATAELSIPVSLIKTLSRIGGDEDEEYEDEEGAGRDAATEALIARLVQQGYVTDNNGILASRIVFSEGKLRVNDKPFNPMSMMR
jgi:uncharacterized protein YdgA (DUF945 family)